MEIAVISGKGGTGKSSISAAFATIARQAVLADCDVDAANLCLIFNPSIEEEQEYVGGQYAVVDHDRCKLCNLCASYCRFDAIEIQKDKIVISEIACDGCQLCERLCPQHAIGMIENKKSRLYSGLFRNGRMVYGYLAPGEENSGKLVNLVRERAKSLALQFNHDHVIIDGPPGIGCPVISSVTGVDHAVIVTEPTVTGLHDLKRIVELISGFGIMQRVIINKYDLNPTMTDRIEEYCQSRVVLLAGKLPYDPRVVEAMVNCKSINEWAPESQISIDLARIWNAIVNFK